MQPKAATLLAQQKLDPELQGFLDEERRKNPALTVAEAYELMRKWQEQQCQP